ncbi:FtsX-like permease family protein [Spirosoma sp. HMF4905]|uniref:FtsX-like permease family protein n=1 Tax=Spirosoma arboris TaxID=2682092 RepID=A0A7K1SGF5_9BACT|nr:ABC transporter permease [Spirosoma arboris]MVM32892.1 FtsX-like permease family protein [Spirosoma arboris]
MLRSYIKIAWRNLWKNKTFSFINILGLALGMACSLLIMIWVQDEQHMDRFHKNDSRLYRVMENQQYTGVVNTYASTPGILAENIVKDIPEIELASQILWENTPLFTVGNIFEKEKGRFVQGDFLTMFSFPLKEGNPKTALKRPDGLVISQKLADKYFKGQDPMGKTIRIDNTDDVMVTGILADIPESSSLKFDFLMSYDRWKKANKWAQEWGNNGPRCYVLLAQNASIDKVNAKIKNYIKTKNKTSNVDLFLQNYGESYLYSNWDAGKQNGGRIEYVKTFSIVAIFILAIACINFMNLATARSVKRSKEVGVRKVVGAYKNSLIGQFLGESMLITLLSLVFSVLLVLLILPVFNTLTEKHLFLDFSNPTFLLLLVSLAVLTGLVSGSYPALFMSSLNPVVILKGALKFKASATYFRKGLVVLQFGLSIMLILGTLVVYRQIQYIQTKNLGYNREGLLYMPLEGDLAKNFQTFRQELEQEPGIKSVTCAQSDPLEVGSSTQGVRWPGKDTTQLILFSQNAISYDYVKTMGIKLLDGRDFSSAYSTDTSNYLINEASARKMGYKDPVGKEMTMWGKKGKIIGLMKDFHYNSLHTAIEPLILHLQRGANDTTNYWGSVLVRTQPGQTKQAVASLEASFKKFNPHFPFKYSFTDQEFANLYKSENTVSKLSSYFAFLAIFISCLGLFGLATFTAEQRTKEIGIRKVLGASVTNLVGMLSKEFIQLVLLAAFIAFPLGWYFLSGWLEKYAYRINLEWWYFLVAILSAVLIALFTVSFQSIKAALMDPVKSLRTE